MANRLLTIVLLALLVLFAGVLFRPANALAQQAQEIDAPVTTNVPVGFFIPLADIADIAAGGNHTCALTDGGGVKCWGDNFFGQLGDGTMTDKNTPVGVAGLNNGVMSIVVGIDDHTCALTNSGGVKCWGYNGFNQLGNDNGMLAESTPVDVTGLNSGVIAITAGWSHTCVLTNSGGVMCWGYNSSGQLGDGTTTTDSSSTPVDVTGLGSGVKAIAAGGHHTCALTNSGGVKCWGNNSSGQLGDGTTADKSTPVDVAGLGSGVMAIATGWSHTCALTDSGGVMCWGVNWNGELGDGTTAGKITPVNVTGLSSGVMAIAAGEDHTCALTNSGSVMCWGSNGSGQLGDGTTADKIAPVNVTGLSSGVMAIAAGGGHTCALTNSGGVMCWGSNGSGQLGDGATADKITPVDVVIEIPCYVLITSHTGNGSDPETAPTQSNGCSTGEYVAGESISLSSTPASGWQVANWSGTNNDASTSTSNSLTMPASNHTVTVNYSEIPPTCYRLTRTHTGSGGDPIATPSKSDSCGTGEYVAGESISLSAAPASGWQVTGWSGTDNDANTNTSNSLTMPASDHTVTVNYSKIPPACYRLTRNHTGNGSDPVATPSKSDGCGTGEYVAGEPISLSAAPANGWQVTSWSGTDNEASASTSNSLTMPAGNHTVTVLYVQKSTSTTSHLYLPLAKRQSPFPSISNGDFDQPGDTSWEQNSLSGLTLIVPETFVDQAVESFTAHSPPNVVWLGGRADERADIRQTFALPSEYENVTLAFYDWVGSMETACEDDKAFVKIDNDTVSTVQLCESQNTGGWRKTIVPLGAYAGRTVTLHFMVELNADNQISNWFIDDVTLCDNTAAHPCP